MNAHKAATGDSIFDAYKLRWNTLGFKNRLKTFLAKRRVRRGPTEAYIRGLRERLKKKEKSTAYYQTCLQTIKSINPDVVFCASQRPIAAVAPMEAAKELGITTACAIYSWDNLPKATLVVEADHYMVWSDHMKDELAFYYPFTKKSRVHVTGTPQFENHYNSDLLQDKMTFWAAHNLDNSKRYICFSGDDITTSPYDPQYLEDVAEVLSIYNTTQSHKVGIIFRRCPVDFTNRYDSVLEKYKDIIDPIAPLWESVGNQWDKKIPTKADLELQANIAHHTLLVINVGSSMVFDYVAHSKPCAYLNYNPEGSEPKVKDIHKIYKYVHFQSMSDKKSVIWLDNKETILKELAAVLDEKEVDVTYAEQWFRKIVRHPVNDASKRIVQSLKSLT